MVYKKKTVSALKHKYPPLLFFDNLGDRILNYVYEHVKLLSKPKVEFETFPLLQLSSTNSSISELEIETITYHINSCFYHVQACSSREEKPKLYEECVSFIASHQWSSGLSSKLVDGKFRVQLSVAFGVFCFYRNSHKYGLGSLRMTSTEGPPPVGQSPTCGRLALTLQSTNRFRISARDSSVSKASH